MSQKQIDDVIRLIAKTHPDFSVKQFGAEFEDIVERPPTFEEKITFKKLIYELKTSQKPSEIQPAAPKVINGFSFSDILGKGSYGKVFKCQKDGKEYAVKEIDESLSTAQVEKDFADSISAGLNSPFLVRYFESFRGSSGELYVVMELCPRGDMKSLIDHLRDLHATLEHKRLAKILIQLVLGLYTLHHNNVLHRDLKPGNIFLDKQDDLKIGDLGCGKVLDTTTEKAQTVIGTPLYESPQVIMGEEYDSAADMWALGVTLYELCTLERPFSDPNIYKLQRLISVGNFAEIPKERAPPELVEIIGSLLNKDPKQRPSALALLQNSYVRMHAAHIDFAPGTKLLSLFPPQIQKQMEAQGDAERKGKAEEETERKRRAEEEAERKKRAEEEAGRKKRAEEEAERKRRAEEEAGRRRRAEEEAERKRRAEEEAGRKKRAEEEAERKSRALEDKKMLIKQNKCPLCKGKIDFVKESDHGTEHCEGCGAKLGYYNGRGYKYYDKYYKYYDGYAKKCTKDNIYYCHDCYSSTN